MSRKISFALLWLGFIAYAFFLAPTDRLDTTFELIKNLSTGHWEGINPLIISLFNLMGILPMIYACLLLIDGRGQKIWAFPFVIGSFAIGAFAILPYLALRQPNPSFTGQKDLALKIVDSRWTGIILTFAALILLIWGFAKGDWHDFIEQWQNSRFIQVMSLDFCLLCLLFPTILGDDLARRGMNQSGIFWSVSAVPLLGALIYLCLRSPLSDQNLETEHLPVHL